MTASVLRLLKYLAIATAFVPLIVNFCGHFIRKDFSAPFFWKLLIVVTLAGVLAFFISRWLKKAYGTVERLGQEQANFLDTLSSVYIAPGILASAALSLLLELIMIRWQSAIFPVLAFYKNLVLLSCFFGLGLGYFLSRKSVVPLFLVLPVLAWQVCWFLLFQFGLNRWEGGNLKLIVSPVQEQLNMGLSTATSIPQFIAIYSFLLIVVLFNALIFLPIGQLCGRLMERMPNLRAYGLNLLGSIAGVLLLFVLSYFWTPPVVWFAISGFPLLLFQTYCRKIILLGAFFCLACITLVAWRPGNDLQQIYSPYQLIEVDPVSGEEHLPRILAAGHYFQRIHNLSFSNSNRESRKELKSIADYYEFPYRAYQGQIGSVAIVGSGAGNDVAAALRSGVQHINAIEIDPVIVKLGKKLHPEKPYSSPNVTVIIDDARSFFRNSRDNYDLVVYGLLDSHTLLSHGSSVRLDSFVYTVEGIREARQRLNENGVLSLSFCILNGQIGRKIYRMMEEAFDGKTPVCVRSHYDGSVIFLQKKNGGLKLQEGMVEGSSFQDVTDHYANPALKADVATDDWPFFYMPQRAYPVSYVVVLFFVFLIAVWLLRNFQGFKQYSLFQPRSLVFFFLGAGFMLIETKSITELGLVFGNTWHVNGLVICGILAMAYLANVVIGRVPRIQLWLLFTMLFLTLVLGYAVFAMGGFPPTAQGRILALVVCTSPIFFSGMIFSALLRSEVSISEAMAANLLGALFGGLLEYNSMYFGFRFLYVLAAALYLFAGLFMWFAFKKKPVVTAQETTTAVESAV